MPDPVSPHTEGHGDPIPAPPIPKTSFHSPSAIIGTPLDPTTRFEYPFPSPEPESPKQYIPPFFNHIAGRPVSTLNPHTTPFPRRAKDPSSSAKPASTFFLHKHAMPEPPIPPSLANRFFELRLPQGRAAFKHGVLPATKPPHPPANTESPT